MAFFPTESLSLSYKLSEQAPTFFLWASSKLLNLLNCARRISAENYQLRISVLETLKWTAKWLTILVRDTQRQFSENICSEDDLRSRVFRTFVVKFLFAFLP